MTEYEPLVGNRAIEDAAVAHVMQYEQLHGRRARDTRHTGAAGDLVSGDRVIEVKAYGKSSRGHDLWLEVRQFEEARRNPNFWLYIVENVRQGDPAQFRLLEIGGAELQALLSRARERRYYEMPWPVTAYDRLVQRLSRQ